MLALLTTAHALAQSGPSPAPSASPTPARPEVFVALYERGPGWDDAKGAFAQTGINEHMQYLRANGDKLIAAAPFGQGITAGSTDRTVGMVIIRASSQEEAQALLSADPSIAGKLMKATVRRWLVERVKAY